MRKLHQIGFLFLVFLLVSCSTKKDKFINRNYHSLTTKYNVLYNGKVAFDQGIEEINTNFQDDFWEQLPIEPIKFERKQVSSSSLGSGFGSSKETTPETPFDKAEEKAVKAIQKHSMNIYGVERNQQIDDAYLLLGKSRYYTQRFIPAIEAFNYVVAKYPKASLIDETKIWRAKSNIRIDNEEFAAETLRLLLRKPDLSDDMREQAETALAMAYVKMDSTHLVKKHLWNSFQTTKNKEQTARNMYVLGQLYSQEQVKDTAAIVFQKVIDFKKAPYKYRIHAEIELAKNTLSDSTNTSLIARFNKLIKNRDNRPYLDALYYQRAELELQRDSIELAIQDYNNSLRSKGASAKQKTYSYERLADLKFKELDFVTASSYYDSVLLVAPEKNNLRIRRIERRVKNLASLIKYEDILQTNDSILRFVAMSEEDRKSYFEDYIATLKKKDEEEAQKQLNKISFGNSFGGSSIQSTSAKGKWYFYNAQSTGYGASEFTKIWGTRPLEDNWRWSDKVLITDQKQDPQSVTQPNKKYELTTYLSQIPSDKKEIDSLVATRNNSLFELGLIYKEQFTNIPKAIDNLERLLSLKPNKKYILPANYHLYQMYQEQGVSQADVYKENILTNYPNSPFAKVIVNPEAANDATVEVDEVSELYSIAYTIYKDDNFEDTVCFINMSLETLENSILIPKFKLLKAYAIGKYQNKNMYKKALEEVAIAYPDTKEGKDALEILNRLKD